MTENEKRIKAINMYKEGIGKKKIRTVLKISRGKLDFWIRSYANKVYLKDKALKLYFDEKVGRYQICRDLKLNKAVLDKWINSSYTKEFENMEKTEEMKQKKQLVIKMYFKEGLDKSKIAIDLNMDKNMVARIINDNSPGRDLKIQQGYSSWISDILRTPKSN